MREAVKPNSFQYWEYLLCYVDDVFVVSHHPRSVTDNIEKYLRFKPGSSALLTHYLGANISWYTIHDGNQDTPMKQVWAMLAQDYIKKGIQEYYGVTPLHWKCICTSKMVPTVCFVISICVRVP
jgi:hypothetical protein